jgi:hypothetical protein
LYPIAGSGAGIYTSQQGSERNPASNIFQPEQLEEMGKESVITYISYKRAFITNRNRLYRDTGLKRSFKCTWLERQ